jgi:D-alanyl-D-alanine carboxypeptidase
MISLTDYTRTAAQRGWGAGWPSCSGAKGQLVIVTAPISGVRISCHQRIARLLTLLITETERRGYLLKNGQTGSYNCRAIGGTNSPSNHSWALAVDINWQDNPFTTVLSANHIPVWMPPLWNRYGFAWGGNYSGGKRDFMHFEFMGSPADADAMTALALHELGGGVAPLAAPTDPGGDMSSMIPFTMVVAPDGTFGASARVESTASGSNLFSTMWVRYGPLWCDADVAVAVQDGKGGMVLPRGALTRCLSNRDYGLQVPPTGLCVTLEGKLLGTDPRRQLCAVLLAADR